MHIVPNLVKNSLNQNMGLFLTSGKKYKETKEISILFRFLQYHNITKGRLYIVLQKYLLFLIEQYMVVNSIILHYIPNSLVGIP